MIKVKIKNQKDLIIPKNANPEDSGYDVIATSDPIIKGEEYCKGSWRSIDYIEYKTNVFIQSPPGYHVLIHPRSSISKYNLVLANSIGLADRGYTGEYICRFKYILQPKDLNYGANIITLSVDYDKIYKKGDKICQLVFEPTTSVEFELVDELSDTNRGIGGFGSTGV